MVQVSLYCAIVRLPQCTFVVDIDTDRSVTHLKKAIKEDNAVDVRCDARKLRLFLAKKDGVWLRDDGDLDKLIQTEGFLDGMEEMRASWELSDPSLFGTGVMLGKKVVHVLVVLPRTMASPLGESITVGGVTIPVTSTMTNSPRAEFWKAFKTIKTPVVADAVITLPGKTLILNQPEFGSCIYIRPCYPQLWDMCRSIFDNEEEICRQLVILGNPGIGKTFFGFLVLLYLARDGKTVVYENVHLGGERTLFSGDMVIKGSHMDFSEVLLQPETFYVVDGVRPSLYVAKTILVTSPRTEIWKKYDQESCKRLYMPVWTQEEIFRCRELLYSSTPVEIVEDRYLKWGGIARYVLRHAQNLRKQQALDQAIAKADLKMTVSASIESTGAESDVCHRLLHFRVNRESLCHEGFDFGSVYIAQRVFATLYKRTRRDLIDFIAASHQLSDFAGERGIFFERLALSMLSQGGSFEARRLTKEGKDYVTGGDEDESKSECVGDDDGGVTMDNRAAFEHVKLRPRKTLFFSQDSEVTNADSDTFLQPASRNFESVDALAKPNELFQVTCARVHPCKQNGLLKALSLLGNPVAPRLYFVVPPDVFEGFKYQDYHTVRGGKVKVVDEKLKKLEQYVIKIDYDYEIRLANDIVEKSISLRVEEGQESSVQSRMSKRSKTANV